MADAVRPLREYRAFVFDFDGVLADSVEIKTEAFGELYRAHGESVVEKVTAHHRSHGGMPRREKFLRWHREFLGHELSPGELDGLSGRFSALVVDKVVDAPEIPGARRFLETWHGRVPLFVDSATPDEEITEIVRRRGLDRFFVSVHGSGQSKVDNLLAILAKNQLNPGDVLFFGDAGSDLKAATACKTDFLAILPGPDAPLAKAHPGITRFATFHEVLAHFCPEEQE